MSVSLRVESLEEELRAMGVDRLLVSAPVNVRYLSGYTGTNGLVVIAAELMEAAVRALGPGGGTGETTLGFDDASLTVKQHSRLRELLPAGLELVPCAGVVERLREVKDEQEAARVRAAAELADEALKGTLDAGQ